MKFPYDSYPHCIRKNPSPRGPGFHSQHHPQKIVITRLFSLPTEFKHFFVYSIGITESSLDASWGPCLLPFLLFFTLPISFWEWYFRPHGHPTNPQVFISPCKLLWFTKLHKSINLHFSKQTPMTHKTWVWEICMPFLLFIYFMPVYFWKPARTRG